MAALTAAVSKHATLTGTTVDSVTLTQGFRSIEVINRDSTDYLWITYGASAPADPTSGGDDTLVVPPASALTIDANNRANFVVKILGDGGAYSVQGVDG